jgi:hypothetical protein
VSSPRRLKDEDGIGATLLRSAADDGAGPSARRAVAAALGLAAIAHGTTTAAAASAAPAATAPVAGTTATVTAATTAPAAAIASKAGISIAAKLIVGLTLATGIGVGVAVQANREPARSAPVARRAEAAHPAEAVAPARVAVMAPTVAADLPTVPVPVDPTTTSTTTTARTTTAPTTTTRTTTVPTTTTAPTAPTTVEPSTDTGAPVEPPLPRTPSIADEVAVLDAALVALREHHAASALRLLDQYDRRFPAGTLASEAAVARIEALVAEGSQDRARALAAQFLAAHGTSPLSQRVRTLMEP